MVLPPGCCCTKDILSTLAFPLFSSRCASSNLWTKNNTQKVFVILLRLKTLLPSVSRNFNNNTVCQHLHSMLSQTFPHLNTTQQKTPYLARINKLKIGIYQRRQSVADLVRTRRLSSHDDIMTALIIMLSSIPYMMV